VLKSFPRAVFVELTQNCNLCCPMCRSAVYSRPEFNMPYSLFQSIAATLFPYAELVDLRGWGESLMYPRIKEAIEYANSFDCRVRILTNLNVGISTLKHIMKNRVITGISLDAANQNLYEKIRVGAKFSRVVTNIKKLVSYREQFNLAKETVYICVVVMRENAEELSRIVKLAHNCGISLIKMFPQRTSLKNPAHPFNCFREIKEGLDAALDLSKKYKVRIELEASLHPDLTIKSKLFQRCTHPWTHCVITYDGKVGYCDHLLRDSLRSWKKNSFHSVWNNKYFQKLRKEHVKARSSIKNRFENCHWCYCFRYTDIENFIRVEDRSRVVSSENTGLYEINPFKGKVTG